MKRTISFVLSFCIILCLFTGVGFTASAATSGYYTYSVENGEAQITEVDTSISGNVTIPSTLGGYPVTSIGSSAFKSCAELASVNIPNSITIIDWYAFAGCTSLTRVELPNSITSISNGVFEDCTELTSVTIPDSVTIIDNNAFAGCTGLTSVSIPSGVTSIGYNAFSRCTGLTAINVDSANQDYSSINGVLFNKDATELVQYPAGKTDVAYTIPNSVITIAWSAFEGCTKLSSVTIPTSVTSIGIFAFSGCTELSKATILSGETRIEESAFDGCDKLTIYGLYGSYAQTYADENDIPFVALSSGSEPEGVLGDANGDGAVNISDAVIVARASAGLSVLNETATALSDVTGDGNVNISDAVLIARYGAGLINTFPAEQ